MTSRSQTGIEFGLCEIVKGVRQSEYPINRNCRINMVAWSVWECADQVISFNRGQ